MADWVADQNGFFWASMALRGLLEKIRVGTDRFTAEGTSRSQQPVFTAAADIEHQITRLQARRAKLMTRWGAAETEDDETAAQDALDANAQELAALRSQQQELTRAQVADQTMAATLAWLEGISDWTALLDQATAAQRNRVYKHLLSRRVYRHFLSTVSVEFSATGQ